MAAVLLCCLLTGCTKYLGTLERPHDPVVLDGSSLPRLLGTAPANVVGFAWAQGVWHQIPVQVDQRDWVSAGQILGEPSSAWPRRSDGSLYKILVYTTPSRSAPGYNYWSTYTGVSSSPTLAPQDEVSFLADDAGLPAPSGSAPPGVSASSVQQVSITDPLHPSDFGYVYLYSSPTLTGGSAGTTGVNYNFSLDSGDYRSTYNMGTRASPPNNTAGVNPERTTIQTPYYSQSYGDRWLNNGLTIHTGSASGAPLLELSDVQVPGYGCARSVNTFDGAVTNPYEGAFVANISGPVRAIRSYMGANSGTYTTSTDIFYPQREDTIGDLRVHPIPNVRTFDDFVTGTPGLTYSDDQNSGVPIDGVPDTISAASFPAWQMVSGPPGSLVTIRRVNTNVSGFTASTYHLDQNPAVPRPCSGDAAAWGQNGGTGTVTGGTGLPCTDPVICANAAILSILRYRYFEPPGVSGSTASALAAQATTPLQTAVTSPGQAADQHSARDGPSPPAAFTPSAAMRRLQSRFAIAVQVRRPPAAAASSELAELTLTRGERAVTLANVTITTRGRVTAAVGHGGPVSAGRLVHVIRRTARNGDRLLVATVLIDRTAAQVIDRALGARPLRSGTVLGTLHVRTR